MSLIDTRAFRVLSDHTARGLQWVCFPLILILVGIGAAAWAPPTVHAQAERVADRFSDDITVQTVPVSFSPGGTTQLCFALESRYDGEELFCYDGSSLRQVTNIAGPGESSDPQFLTVYDDGSGPKLYFSAESDDSARRLYVYDGSSVQLAASGIAQPSDLTVYDGKLYYSAFDGSETELHAYDGSTEEEVVDINESGGSTPRGLTVYDGDLYYSAYDGSDRELHAYDGSSDEEVADINGSGDSDPAGLTVYDDGSGPKLYYRANDGSDTELRVFDGTSDSEAADINGSGDSDPSGLTVYDGDLYYSASDGSDRELHAYDGSSDQEVDINGAGDSDPRDLTVYDGTLYYGAFDGSDRELHAYDGSSDEEVVDINGAGSSGPVPLLVYDDGSGPALYLQADDGTGPALRSYDGSSLTEIRTRNNARGVGVSSFVDKAVYDGVLYFPANGGTDGQEVWTYDGTSVSQRIDVNQSGSSAPEEFTVYDGNLYFVADGGGGPELWQYDGTTLREIDINPSGGSNPSGLTVYDGKLYYSAYDGSDRELHAYDGSSDEEEVVDINGAGDSDPGGLTVYDGDLYYSADDGTDRELYVYDGSSNQEVDINESGSSNPGEFAVHDGILYFAADGGETGVELWGYDGSTAARIADINPFGNSNPEYLASYDGDLYYRAYDGDDRELHVYDGSSDSEVADINPSGSSDPLYMTAFGGRLYFVAYNGTDGFEPHAYDGSSVTSIDLNPGAPSSGGVRPVPFDDGGASGTDLYVTATDGTTGLELYRFAADDAPLPVELAGLDATQSGGQAVTLTWTTATEQGNAGFRVQHRRVEAGEEAKGSGETSWQKVGYVESKTEGGTSTGALSYRFTAEDLSVGSHQFRLKQVDTDGTTHVHEPVSIEVDMQRAARLSAPAPNPVRRTARLQFAVREAQPVTIAVYNVLGQKVEKLYDARAAAQERTTVTLSARGLASGVYFVRMQAPSATKTRRVTVAR